MSNTIKKTGLSLGIVLGIILILVSAYIYFEDLSLYSDVDLGLALIGITILFGIISIIIARKKLKGFITFKEAFTSYFYTVVTAKFMSLLFTVIVFSSVLPPDSKTTLKKQMENFSIAHMKQNQMPEKEIIKNIEKLKTYDPFTPSQIIQPALMILLLECMFGFLAALIIRNKRTLI
jgi:uncharacterized protein DUF4199